jgi:hypothetical protein
VAVEGADVTGEKQGRRRADKILEPGFSENVGDLDLDEVRRRRDECLAEREYLSYLRRLLHGRLEILRAEAKARADGVEVPLVDRLASILGSDTPIGPSRGEALRVGLPEEEMNNARRRVERLLASSAFSDPETLDEDAIATAIGTLEREERSVSDTRKTVMDLHDLFQDEIKRRYKERLTSS